LSFQFSLNSASKKPKEPLVEDALGPGLGGVCVEMLGQGLEGEGQSGALFIK
jgi:hypothetical protein